MVNTPNNSNSHLPQTLVKELRESSVAKISKLNFSKTKSNLTPIMKKHSDISFLQTQ